MALNAKSKAFKELLQALSMMLAGPFSFKK
jgi:hypothetical protein